MPRHSTARARPARSRHGGTARQSRAVGQARLRGAAQDLRRRRRRPHRHGRRDQAPQPEAGPRLRHRGGAADRPRRVRAAGRRRRVARRIEPRHAAAGAGQSDLLREGLEDREEGHREVLPRRMSADRDLARPRPRPARQDDPQGGERDRAPAGCFPCPRRAALAPTQPQDDRRCHRDARVRRSRASPPTNTWRRAAAPSR